ncbi:hypothetical protein Bca4012_058380 [Brassica carinata]
MVLFLLFELSAQSCSSLLRLQLLFFTFKFTVTSLTFFLKSCACISSRLLQSSLQPDHASTFCLVSTSCASVWCQLFSLLLQPFHASFVLGLVLL